MAEMMTTDVRAIMDRSPFDVAAVGDLREVLNRDPSRYRTLREAVAEYQGTREKGKGCQNRTPISGWESAKCCWAGTSPDSSN